ncbi:MULTISPECIES: hypothetical protein [unclassified Paenibacillus]|uniref:hypothetical protein n=1 Tax=unclassified Paenibacillus TaxID=185978 RepID=UPI001AE5BB70|nr:MULTISPECIES: hypothetical protein [unclassified Paenibacillus]MBP1157741.1 AmiR/NasT family two-component response regulator [Paenibacillus sp. PvP091]MBP1171523.1 AmiR/NasT family two-component response regulator [Paenibacillus sp. PvR098]MBP2442551.1 AmiR/NasT family two-component response regulator [Paenibacillus sp. PvP052]
MFTGQQQQGMNTVTSKELAYISDGLKNEELIAKIAVQGVAESQTPQLKQKLAQMAQDRLQNADQLLRTLQQHTQMTQ